MDEVLKQLVTDSPTIAVLIYLVWRLDHRLASLQDTILQLLQDRLQIDDAQTVETER